MLFSIFSCTALEEGWPMSCTSHGPIALHSAVILKLAIFLLSRVMPTWATHSSIFGQLSRNLHNLCHVWLVGMSSDGFRHGSDMDMGMGSAARKLSLRAVGRGHPGQSPPCNCTYQRRVHVCGCGAGSAMATCDWLSALTASWVQIHVQTGLCSCLMVSIRVFVDGLWA